LKSQARHETGRPETTWDDGDAWFERELSLLEGELYGSRQ
jgi:hypothetical protein